MTIKTIASAPALEQKKTPLLHKIALVLGVMTLIGGSLTGIMTYRNIGFTDTFFLSWLTSFITALFTVMPAGFILMALVTKLVEKLTPKMRENKRNLIVGVGMACVMESFMAFSTAANNIGFHDLSAFYHGWLNGLLAALPVALTLSTVITMTIKPKIERFLRS
ncbi:DUF2798 domain-containing protein [Marinomonas sp. NPDC078689]|uniref:DUF2798 domain-containing protein n=1 Tax=Marinomonas sp. NPDC078689 TaxID=3364147 RepID=UPI0037C55E69